MVHTEATERTAAAAAAQDAGNRGSVLLVANYESDVGYAWWLMENFWSLIASAARAQGRTCLLAYPRIGEIPEIIRAAPLTSVELRIGRSPWSNVWRGLRFIRQHRVRSVYLSDWPNVHWVYLLWRLAGVRRIVVHMHAGTDRPPVRGIRALAKDALHRARLLSATLYVAPSHYMGTKLRDVARVPAARCTVVTNGIRLFSRDNARQAWTRQRLGVPEDAILIALVGRANFEKGLDFAIRCMARLLEDPALRGRVFAVHCGDGPDLETLRQLARDANVQENFRFLGRRNDVRDILCAADIAFHPSRREAMALSVLEFLCAGLAVLTSDVPSVSTAVKPGVTGLTYPRENVEEAVAVLRRLIDDPALRRTLGSAAASACRAEYSLETMNRAFVAAVVPGI